PKAGTQAHRERSRSLSRIVHITVPPPASIRLSSRLSAAFGSLDPSTRISVPLAFLSVREVPLARPMERQRDKGKRDRRRGVPISPSLLHSVSPSARGTRQRPANGNEGIEAMQPWMWLGLGSAVFAALVGVVGKKGLDVVDPTLATAIRAVIMAVALVVTAL